MGQQRVEARDGKEAFIPPEYHQSEFERLDRVLLGRLESLPGLTSTASDVLDGLARPMVVPADVLRPRLAGRTVVGHAVTVRYLPERRSADRPDDRRSPSRLANAAAAAVTSPGDVIVIDACGIAGISTCGGMAALAAHTAGVRGIVVDGAIRDVDEFEEVGFPAWSRSVTPRTGKYRLEAVAINGPICCGGEHVRPGDLVLADPNGVCFLPPELAAEVAARVIEVAEREAAELRSRSGREA